MLSYIGTWEFLRTLEKCEKHSPSARASPHCSLFSFTKCIMNCARSYRWRRLRALYLNSALVWLGRVLYGNIMNSFWPIMAYISLNILKQVIKHTRGGRAILVLVRRLVSLLSRCYRGHSSLEVSFNSWNEFNWFPTASSQLFKSY